MAGQGGGRAWVGKKFSRNDRELGMAMRLKEKCDGHMVMKGWPQTAEAVARQESAV